MNIKVTGKEVKVTDAIKDYAEKNRNIMKTVRGIGALSAIPRTMF